MRKVIVTIANEEYEYEAGIMYEQIAKDFQKDYEAVKACDLMAAWIEAYVSIQYGVSSKILRDAKVQTGYKLMTDRKGIRIGASQILADFEKMTI